MSGETLTSPVVVVIATSGARTQVLIDRALHSVYAQKDVVPQCIYVVDDNPRKCGERQSSEFKVIQEGVSSLRKSFLAERYEEEARRCSGIMKFDEFFRTLVIPNRRTHGVSGTGSWNTAAMDAFQSKYQTSDSHKYQSPFLSILDDDDKWTEDHLSSCLNKALPLRGRREGKCVAVIPSIRRIGEEGKTEDMIPDENNFTAEELFKGNPGFQGSSIFIELDAFWSLGGFDESMPSCTDRDLAIRLLEYVGRRKKRHIKFTGKVTVKHYTTSTGRVTVNRKAKTGGLNHFYRKHWARFGESYGKPSLERAKELFGYKPPPDRVSELSAGTKPPATTAASVVKPFNLHIGAISDSSYNTKELLKSFLKLYKQDGKWLSHHTFHLLDNSDDDIGIKPMAEYFKKWLNIQVHGKKCPEKLNIAEARTALQRHILKAGREMHGDDFVAWIVDDDSIFHTDLKGGGREETHYFQFIAQHRGGNIDGMLGLVSGAPPLPFISTLRTQLLDFYYNLSNFSSCKPTDVACESLLNCWQQDNPEGEDFYYDLSKRRFDHLEKPMFWQPDYSEKPDMKVHEAFELFLKDTAGLEAGANVFRNLTYAPEEIGVLGEESVHRGGNTIIYRSAMLDVSNYTPPENEKGDKYNRRSDFNWAIINKHIYRRTLREITLPIHHSRNLLGGAPGLLSDEGEEKKFKADVMGMLFYRLLERMLQSGSVLENNGNPDKDLLEEFHTNMRSLVTQIRANTYRARTLCYGVIHVLKDTNSWWFNDTYRGRCRYWRERNLTMLRELRYNLGRHKQQKYIEAIPARMEKKMDEEFIAKVRDEMKRFQP